MDALATFETLLGRPAYNWQRRLYAALHAGDVPSGLPLPTGLGKTSAVLLYLLALAAGAPLPVRLAYLVDRRAIVDQTAATVRRWLDALCALPEWRAALAARAAFPIDGVPVAVGVLRGGLADSGEWRSDPARPAVIVGTVDMIGSRLLFSGYGDGRSRRALHAGLLGCDTTVIVDESHLCPAMGPLLRTIERLQREHLATVWRPRFRVMTMSATPERTSDALTLDDADRALPAVHQRLHAAKALHLQRLDKDDKLVPALLRHLEAFECGAIVCFVRTVKDATAVYNGLHKRFGLDRVGLLTGTLRGKEREALFNGALWRRFDPDRSRDGAPAPAVFLVSTAAGEVGIDFDADHAVMDLAPLDSVIQRLGRVNRAGLQPAATVQVVAARASLTFNEKKLAAAEAVGASGETLDEDEDGGPEGDDFALEPDTIAAADTDDTAAPDDDGDKKKPSWRDHLGRAQARTLALLETLPDASPATLAALSAGVRRDASTPLPKYPPLGIEQLTLLAATSAELPRINLEPFLRGLSDEPARPETQVLWRNDVDTLVQLGPEAARDALTLLPPLPRELLQLPTDEAEKTLAELAKKGGTLACIVRDARGSVSVHRLSPGSRPPALAYATLILPAAAGGLDPAGLFKVAKKQPEVEDLADNDERRRFEQCGDQAPAEAPDWLAQAVQLRFALHDPDAEPEDRRWLVYARRRGAEFTLAAEGDLSQLAYQPQTVDEHDAAVGHAAGRLARALGLPAGLVAAIAAAGHAHDLGKKRARWQRAAGHYGPECYAKSRTGTFRPALLGGYRHEFGSLVDVLLHQPLPEAPEPWLHDLALHLIAAHHGHARPGFPDPMQWDPERPIGHSAEVAEAVERRYATLQQHCGPWTLAWFEALLKAADAWVSAGNTLPDEGGACSA